VILPVAELGPARIGEHYVDTAQLLNRLSHSPPRFVRVGHVSFDHNRLHPRVFTLPLHLLRRLKPVEVVDRHVAAFLREGDRELLAQPG